MRTAKLILLLTLLSVPVAYAGGSSSPVECRIYDPSMRCKWVLKSDPYPKPYQPVKSVVNSRYKKRSAAQIPNPVMSPLPVVAEQRAAAAALMSSGPKGLTDAQSTKPGGIVMDTVTGMTLPQANSVHITGIPAGQSTYKTAIDIKSTQKNAVTPVMLPEKPALTGHVEINELVVAPRRSQDEPKKAVVSKKVEVTPPPERQVKNASNQPKQLPERELTSNYSWVNTSSQAICPQIVDEIVAFINQESPNKGAILQIKPALQNDNRITPLLINKLKAQGYNIANERAQLLNSANMRYIVDESTGGLLVRVQLSGIDGAKWFVMDQNGTKLLSASAFTVRRGN